MFALCSLSISHIDIDALIELEPNQNILRAARRRKRGGLVQAWATLQREKPASSIQVFPPTLLQTIFTPFPSGLTFHSVKISSIVIISIILSSIIISSFTSSSSSLDDLCYCYLGICVNTFHNPDNREIQHSNVSHIAVLYFSLCTLIVIIILIAIMIVQLQSIVFQATTPPTSCYYQHHYHLHILLLVVELVHSTSKLLIGVFQAATSPR